MSDIIFSVPRSAMMVYRFCFGGIENAQFRRVQFESIKVGRGKSKIDMLVAVGTNGHHLLKVSWPKDQGDDLEGAGDVVAIDCSEIDTLLSSLQAEGKATDEPFHYGRDYKFTIASHDGRVEIVAINEGIDHAVMDAESATFGTTHIKWSDIIPRKGKVPVEQRHWFSINDSYYMQFFRFTQEFGQDEGVRIDYSGIEEPRPILFTPLDEEGRATGLLKDGSTAEYVLMPLRE